FEDDIPNSPLPFVAINYEGGLVARHQELLGSIPSAREQAATMSPDQVRALADQAGQTMRSYGVTLDFAPVADLDLGSPIIDSLLYGSETAHLR
ncbi:MAG: beta-N-acetylhexosaminidase, partial [Actinomycetota bacterium]|nr:beta-N-acetylhexosaminidase [Actinomycetota bacterium]